MSTPFSAVTAVFFDLIEEDSTFFKYYNATDEESYRLAVQRAEALLRDAAVRVMMECECDINFTEYQEDEDGNMQFVADLNAYETDLLANLMYEGYLKRDVSKLRAFSQQYTPTDLQAFSPANDRKTFMEMYSQICEENKVKLDRYKSKDRITGETKGIDYASYDTEEE